MRARNDAPFPRKNDNDFDAMTCPSHLQCTRCAKRFPLAAYARGCDACLHQGFPASLTVGYDQPHAMARASLPAMSSSMWRYASLLHATADDAVTLGEGLTPLVHMPSLGLGELWL